MSNFLNALLLSSLVVAGACWFVQYYEELRKDTGNIGRLIFTLGMTVFSLTICIWRIIRWWG